MSQQQKGLSLLVVATIAILAVRATNVMTTATGFTTSQSVNMECDACEWVVRYAEDYLARNTTLNRVESVVEHACELVPNRFRTSCDNVVESYLPQLIKYIESVETPEVVCSQIGVC